MPRPAQRPKFSSKGAAALALFLLAAPAWAALEIPERPSGYVNDYAGALSAEAEGRIEETLAAFERETSNQVVVAVFSSLSGEVLEDFTIRLAEKWKLGRADKDNGVILAVFTEDRAIRIETGYGLEGALPDATAHAIIRNEMVPAFREGNTDAGVERGVAAILAATRGEYAAEAPVSQRREAAQGLFSAVVLFLLFIPPVAYALTVLGCMYLFGFPAGFMLGLSLAAVLAFFRSVLFRGVFGQTIGGPGFRAGGFGGGSFGSGGFGGGGFGGGGGGSFGGGGASGRW